MRIFQQTIHMKVHTRSQGYKNAKKSRFLALQLRCCKYPANKCENANNCWHFNIYEQDKCHAQLS